MNKSEVSGVVFIDLKKAFDLVDHDILLEKLAIYLKNSSFLSFFKSYLHNRTQCVLLHGSYSSKESVKYGVPQGSILGPILFSLFINDLQLHVKDISVDCDMLADDKTLHTSGKDIMQIRSNMQDNLDQVSNGCDNNHMVINPIKTKSVTIATRQKHQLSPLPLDLVLNGAKLDQVSEHRLLGITIDNKLRWDSHINNVCKTVSRRVFLLSKLRYIVDIDTRKLFFNAHIKLHIDYASVVWDGCSNVLKKILNSLHRRAVKLILPDTTLATDQKLKEMRIMSLQKQPEYNKGLFMYRLLSDEAPEYRSVGIAQWLERRTRDRKVAGSNPCCSGGRIFFSRVNFLCWLLFRYPFHPRVTAVARKRPRSFCPKRRWQVTAKHAYTLRMWLCMKWHGAWLYGVHRTRRDWLSLAADSCGTSHVSAVSTPFRWIFKNAI